MPVLRPTTVLPIVDWRIGTHVEAALRPGLRYAALHHLL
jgi:hypothetical protein